MSQVVLLEEMGFPGWGLSHSLNFQLFGSHQQRRVLVNFSLYN